MKRYLLIVLTILCLLILPSMASGQTSKTEQIGTVNSQTGTSYTIAFSDRGKLVTFNNASPVAVTLPQATAAGSFRSGWTTFTYNLGAGTVTITPTTSTINGGATITLATGEGAAIFSNGSNYLALRTTVATGGAGGIGTVTTTGSPASGNLTKFSGATSVTNADLTGDVTTSGGVATTLAATANTVDSRFYCADAGANDTYACNLSPAIGSYTAGTHYRFKANTVNTGAASISFNSIGALTIKKHHDQDLADGDIEAGAIVECVYDGTNCEMISQLGNAPSGGTVTASSTDTFTNKTYDAEGTGNTLTQAFKIWLPAAGCANTTAASFWDLPTSTPAVAACVTGTNTQKGVLTYADTSGGFSAQNSFLLPSDWSGNIDANIIWKTSATSGDAKFSLSTICTAVNASETDDPAFNTASTVTTTAAGTANRLQTSSISSVTITGCAAGEFLHLKLFRDGNDGSDTLSASLDVIGVEIIIRRAQ